MRQEKKRLQKKVEELQERLGLNSNNSSKPPSTDKKKNKQSPKGGAKRGHTGHFRRLFPEDKVTKRVVSSLTTCPHCGSKDLKKKTPHVLQQVELPDIDPIVTGLSQFKIYVMLVTY